MGNELSNGYLNEDFVIESLAKEFKVVKINNKQEEGPGTADIESVTSASTSLWDDSYTSPIGKDQFTFRKIEELEGTDNIWYVLAQYGIERLRKIDYPNYKSLYHKITELGEFLDQLKILQNEVRDENSFLILAGQYDNYRNQAVEFYNWISYKYRYKPLWKQIIINPAPSVEDLYIKHIHDLLVRQQPLSITNISKSSNDKL